MLLTLPRVASKLRAEPHEVFDGIHPAGLLLELTRLLYTFIPLSFSRKSSGAGDLLVKEIRTDENLLIQYRNSRFGMRLLILGAV